MAVAADALLVADGLGDGHAQRNADVLNRVMSVDVQVADGLNVQVDQAVARDLIEHVIEKGNARVELLHAGAVQIDGHPDPGFIGVTGNFCGAGHDMGSVGTTPATP